MNHPEQSGQHSRRDWREKLRNEVLTVGTFNNLPDHIYFCFLDRGEWLSKVSGIHCITFCLLVVEAA